jgi:hypothetical protein
MSATASLSSGEVKAMVAVVKCPLWPHLHLVGSVKRWRSWGRVLWCAEEDESSSLSTMAAH